MVVLLSYSGALSYLREGEEYKFPPILWMLSSKQMTALLLGAFPLNVVDADPSHKATYYKQRLQSIAHLYIVH